MLLRRILAPVVVLALAGCTSAAERQRNLMARQATEFLDNRGPEADPGKVAATDIAFARAAQDEGQWAAFVRYAADGAVLDAPGGFVTLDALRQLAEPESPLSWAPTDVWTSCDGTIAVSAGRYAEGGMVGDYVTAWQWQRGGDYRWTYDTGVLDDPQPAPRVRPEAPEGEDVILVDALTAINARTADCAREGEGALPPPPAIAVAQGAEYGFERSPDNTLQYWWEHRPGGERLFVLEYLRDGLWQRPVEMTIPAGQ